MTDKSEVRSGGFTIAPIASPTRPFELTVHKLILSRSYQADMRVPETLLHNWLDRELHGGSHSLSLPSELPEKRMFSSLQA